MYNAENKWRMVASIKSLTHYLVIYRAVVTVDDNVILKPKAVYRVLYRCCRSREDEPSSDMRIPPPELTGISASVSQPQPSIVRNKTLIGSESSRSPILDEQIPDVDGDTSRHGAMTNGFMHDQGPITDRDSAEKKSESHDVHNVLFDADVQSRARNVAEKSVTATRTCTAATSGGGRKGHIELLPPTAFLFKKDGTSLVSNGNDAHVETSSSCSGHTMSPRSVKPSLFHESANVTIGGAGGDSLGGATSLDELRSRHQFASAAEELVYIRTELQRSERSREKLRSVFKL